MKVSNPLTIIAIFSGVAESFATGALVLLPGEMQEIFIWFVMGFPLLIITLFFIVLYFKNQVLYAPSDFDNEKYFVDILGLPKDLEKVVEKLLFEAKENNDFSGNVDVYSKLFVQSAVKEIKSDIEERIFQEMADNPNSGYTERGLGHLFSISTSAVRESLLRLEKQGKIQSGIESESKCKIWIYRKS